MKSGVPELEFLRPWDVPEEAVTAFRDAFFAAGERVINGSGGLDFYPDWATWISYLQRVESGEEEGFVPSRVYFARLAGSEEPAGVLDIRPGLPPEKEYFGHMGYAVRPDCRGQGVASAILDYGVRCLRDSGLQEIAVHCYETNTASQRVLENYGFVLDSQYQDKNDGLNVLKYLLK